MKRDPANCDALWGAAKLKLDADKQLDETSRGRMDAYARSCPPAKGVKYELPRKFTDLAYPAAGFAVAAPILIALGLALGFMGPFQMPVPFRAGAFGLLFLKTLLGVAIPEELLFRGLIQNWLMQQFGFTHRTLFLAALIFGAAHLNNAPGSLPNWRYMILATIAGFIYGKVFWKSSTVLSSAGLHAFVNSIRHMFFS